MQGLVRNTSMASRLHYGYEKGKSIEEHWRMKMSIGAITSTISNAASTSAKTSMSAMTTNDFIKLLLTQLKNQDPTNPMDSSDMLSQFSSLTQLQMSQKSYDATQALIQTAATGYIGKTISYSGAFSNQIIVEDGQAGSVQYALDDDASNVSVAIYDDSGKTVRTGSIGYLSAGTHSYHWDGKDGSGENVPDGSYTIQLSAKDKSGNSLAVSTLASAGVSGVYFKSGETYLMTSAGEIPLSAVKGISN